MRELFLELKILLAVSRLIRSRSFILGPVVRTFEEQISRELGSRYAFGVASGTDALILALKACGIGPGDEVIVPALGFSSTAAAVSWINAKPVFVDIDPVRHTIDISKIGAVVTARTKAIIPIHLNGRAAQVDVLADVAHKKSLRVIVDAAHAVGTLYRDRPIGHYGDLVCLSFNFTKLLGTYGDGGAVFTSNRELAEKISLMRMYGAPAWHDIHHGNLVIGVASRLGAFQAAVLNEKFPFLSKWISRQRESYFFYLHALQGVGGLELPAGDLEEEGSRINGYRFPVLTKRRDELQAHLARRGVRTQPFYPVPLPYLHAFHDLGYRPGDFPVAEHVAREVLVLPTHYSLSKQECIEIVRHIKDFFSSSKAL